jgi:hypothetical protein
MRCVHRRVAMLSIMSLLPSYIHTQKKNLHLLCEACCRNEMGGLLQSNLAKEEKTKQGNTKFHFFYFNLNLIYFLYANAQQRNHQSMIKETSFLTHETL